MCHSWVLYFIAVRVYNYGNETVMIAMSKDVDFYENLIYYGINEHTFALKGAFES